VRIHSVSRGHSRLTIWLAVVWSLVVMAHPGYTIMRTLDLAELARQADTIVLGVVRHQESAWEAQQTAIHTDVTVAVERALVGAPGDEVQFRVAGGTVGGVGMRSSNDPRFQVGERVIVFLDTRTVPASVVGMQQGKFVVQENIVMGLGEVWTLDDFIVALDTARR
jgi:hypothetical protein